MVYIFGMQLNVELFAIEIALDVYNGFYIHEEFLNFWTQIYVGLFFLVIFEVIKIICLLIFTSNLFLKSSIKIIEYVTIFLLKKT